MDTLSLQMLSSENISKLTEALQSKVMSELTRRQPELKQNRQEWDEEQPKKVDKKESGYVSVSDEDYDKHMAVIMSMKPKKRKNWSSKLFDKQGVRTRLYYKDGKIWDSGHSCGITKSKAEVKPARWWVEKMQKGDGDVKCYTHVGLVADICEKMKMEYSSFDRVLGCEIIIAILDRLEKTFFETVQDLNKTGNHYRTHMIKCKNLYGHD